MRRMFRRELRRGFAGPDMILLLQRANELMAAEDYAGAANSFEQLARAAESRGGRHASLDYFQAGRARILAGQTAMGLDLIERSLGLLAARGHPRKLGTVAYRIVNELDSRGLKEEARRIAAYAASLLPGLNLQVVGQELQTKHPPLPTHCPRCGAPVHPAEVDWIDQNTAECDYCGTTLQATQS